VIYISLSSASIRGDYYLRIQPFFAKPYLDPPFHFHMDPDPTDVYVYGHKISFIRGRHRRYFRKVAQL
jgi:hypothetical protein